MVDPLFLVTDLTSRVLAKAPANVSPALLLGVVLWAVVHLAFLRWSKRVTMLWHEDVPRDEENLFVAVSPVFSFAHELAHAVAAVVVGVPVTKVRFGMHYFSYPGPSGTQLGLSGPMTYLGRASALRMALVAAGPLWICLPVALALVAFPVFESALLNGLLVGYFVMSGLDTLLSVTDRAIIRACFAPLAYLLAALASFLAGGFFLAKHLAT